MGTRNVEGSPAGSHRPDQPRAETQEEKEAIQTPESACFWRKFEPSTPHMTGHRTEIKDLLSRAVTEGGTIIFYDDGENSILQLRIDINKGSVSILK